MKKAFSLIEVMVSIAIFMILLLFLYKSLDVTQTSNQFYENKLEKLNDTNWVKSILYEDIAQASAIDISFDSKGYNILKLQSSNMFHNVFYKHITYVISSEKSLIRIESLNAFNEKELLDSFFNEAYADKLLTDIEKFKISTAKSNQNIYSVLLKQYGNGVIFFNTMSILK